MSGAKNLFEGDPNAPATLDIDAPLARVKILVCEHYWEAFRQAAIGLVNAGESEKAAVFCFLQHLTGLRGSWDTPATPFVPMWQGGGNSPSLGDLSKSDLAVVRYLSEKTNDPSLHARLKDLLWVREKDHIAGQEAVRSYCTLAQNLGGTTNWNYSIPAFKRALYLARRFGKAKPLAKKVEKALEQAAINASRDRDKQRCGELMEVMLTEGVGNPKAFAKTARRIARKAGARKRYEAAESYWRIAARWAHHARDFKAEERAQVFAGEALMEQARTRNKGRRGSAMAAANLMVRAIEQLRRSGVPKSKIEPLQAELRAYQKRSLLEMRSLSYTVDLRNEPVEARKRVQEADFSVAAMKLAFGKPLFGPKSAKQAVLASVKAAPLLYLMGAMIIDHEGRKIARKEPLFDLKGNTNQQALEAEAFSYAAQNYWPLRVSAFIEPAREQILNDHNPSFRDILFIVQSNPFIPAGHEGIFLRGLHAGFQGDFLSAAHLLTPQIENSLRFALESRGVNVSNIKSDGIQHGKMLGGIFSLPETEKLLGEDFCFELRGCLIEKTGYDFRNHVAHGFVSEGECYAAAGITVWWLVLRFCLTPLFESIKGHTLPEPPTSDRTARKAPVEQTGEEQ